MRFLKNLKISSAASRLLEEKIYETVALEIQRGELRTGLWAKALAESRGDEAKAKSIYISLRVQSVKDEIAMTESINNSAAYNSKKDKPTNQRENSNNKFAIYVSCKSNEEHEAILNNLRTTGIPMHSTKNLYVVMGPFPSKDKAGEALRTLIFKYKIDGHIEQLK